MLIPSPVLLVNFSFKQLVSFTEIDKPYVKGPHAGLKHARTIVGRVDGELDDGVTDVCLRFSGG